MDHLISKYLFQNKAVALPGVGNFSLIAINATTDIASKYIQAPGWNIQFDEGRGEVSDDFIQWLSLEIGSDRKEAEAQFLEFCHEVKLKLDKNEPVDVEGIGSLKKNNNDTIEFTAHHTELSPFSNVTAEKVVRENAPHTLLVGEKERSNIEMQQALHKSIPPRSGHRKVAVILLLGALALLAIVLYKNGCSLKATGNQQKVEVKKTGETYRFR